jgi:hypothetical protein
VQPAVGDVTDPEERERRQVLYTEYLETADPCVEEQGGDTQLFRVVQYGAYDLALPTEDVLVLIREHFDPRCKPPWGDQLEKRVLHKAKDAKTKSTKPRAEPMPADVVEFLDAKPSKPAPLPTAEAFAEAAKTPAAAHTPKLPVVWGRWDEPAIPPVYLLEGLIPEGKVVAFYAEGGSVKSWAAFALAIAVATGQPWLGEYPVQRGKVLIVDFEDGREEFKRRKGLLTKNTEALPELGYLYGGCKLTDNELWLEIAAYGLRLVVVDALASGMPPDADENDARFAHAVKLAGKFTEATGCTVLFVHHSNKQGGMRGTSAVRDQCDVVYKFHAVSDTDDVKRMRLECDKPGPQKKPKPVNIELSDEGLKTFKDEAQAVGRNAMTESDVRAAVLLSLANGPVATARKIRDATSGDRAKVYRELQDMQKEGLVVYMKERGGYQLDDDGKRTERVLACLRSGELFTTCARLAKAAYTDTRVVEALERRNVIFGSAEGRLHERDAT